MEPMLGQLRDAHDALLHALASQEEVMGRAAPDRAALSHLGIRISKASRQRKALVQDVTAYCLEDASPEEAHALEALSRDATELTLLTTRHIGRWTMPMMFADWAGCRSETTMLRMAMRKRVELERSALYPMLQARMHI